MSTLVGVGTDVRTSFAIETTPYTREEPTTSVEIAQESMQVKQDKIRSAGMGGGRRIQRRSVNGQRMNDGTIGIELGTTALSDLMRLCIGGTPVVTGDGPFTSVFTPGELPTSTWQIVKPHGGDGLQPFDFFGSMVNSWTLTQNANEIGRLDIELFAYKVALDQALAPFAAPLDPQLLTFQDVTVTSSLLSGGDPVCFDGFSLQGSNNLARPVKSCADDAGQPKPREVGMRTITGTLNDDFRDMEAHNAYLENTEGTLTLAYAGPNGSSLTIDLTVVFTGETPTVSGPSEIKQGIGFEVQSNVSDADAITVTLVNGES